MDPHLLSPSAVPASGPIGCSKLSPSTHKYGDVFIPSGLSAEGAKNWTNIRYHTPSYLRIEALRLFCAALAASTLLLSAFSCQPSSQAGGAKRWPRQTAPTVVDIANPLSRPRTSLPVVIQASDLPHLMRSAAGMQVVDPFSGPERKGRHLGTIIPSQLDDLDGDGKWDELAFECDLAALERKPLHLYPLDSADPQEDSARGVDATISKELRFTRLALESERITYSVYDAAALDAIGKLGPGFNIRYFFGEKKRSPDIKENEEHGHDFVPVGLSMGAASFCLIEDPAQPQRYARPWTANSLFFSPSNLREGGAVFEFQLLANGPARAMGRVKITHWKTEHGHYECLLFYTVWAKQQHIRIDINFTRAETGDRKPVLAIGFRQMPNETFFKATSSYACAVAEDVFSPASRGVIADLMGLALLYSPDDFDNATQSEDDAENRNHLVLLKNPGRRRTTFHACAAWNRDEAVQSPEQWESSITMLHEELNHPAMVTVSPNFSQIRPDL